MNFQERRDQPPGGIVGTLNSGPSATETAPTSPADSRRLAFYLLPLILSPILFFVAAYLIVPSKWLALRSGNTYLANLGYGATLYGVDCQVVVSGDSSAMVGVDPGVIRRRTGLNTCNIAEFEGMTILNGTMVVDRYLAQNARPRFLVFLYTPEDFDPQSQRREVGMYEAATWRLSQPHRLSNLIAVVRRPDEFFTWAEQGLRLAVERIMSKPASPEILQFRAEHQGQLPIHAPPLTACEGGRPYSAPDRNWVSGLRAKYGGQGITVLIDSTPMPPCDPELAYFQQRLPGVIDNSVETVPLEMFTADGRLHANAAGAARISNMIADQIVQRMSADSAAGAH